MLNQYPPADDTPKRSKPNSDQLRPSQDTELINAMFNPYLPIAMFNKQCWSLLCWQVFVLLSQLTLTIIGL